MVGDDDIGAAGVGPGLLGEALLAEGAGGRAHALVGRDGHLAPGEVADPGDELVAVAGDGLLRPFVQPLHLAPERGQLAGVEQLRVIGLGVPRGLQPVPAQVVAPALEDRERGFPLQQRSESGGQPRQIAFDELALQGDGGGGDHHRGALDDGMADGRYEVGERLPRAGARLDHQVLFGIDRGTDRLGHGHLAIAATAAEGVHRSVQQCLDVGKFCHG